MGHTVAEHTLAVYGRHAFALNIKFDDYLILQCLHSEPQ